MADHLGGDCTADSRFIINFLKCYILIRFRIKQYDSVKNIYIFSLSAKKIIFNTVFTQGKSMTILTQIARLQKD